MTAYYNEHDPGAAAWLRELIRSGLIAEGVVDERSICDVRAIDLAGYTQCHFFAGIGIWSLALRQAGWPDTRPVWTGSCPCQPFSAAGKRGGLADERHLWPDFFRLIRERRPSVVYGEQVASKDGLAWLDSVQADMESAHYAFGAFDLCAAGFGAPHIRQRLFFVADADGDRCGRSPTGEAETRPTERWDPEVPRANQLGELPAGLEGSGVELFDRVVHCQQQGLERLGGGHQATSGRVGEVRPVAPASESCGMADDNRDRRCTRIAIRPDGKEYDAQHGSSACGMADSDECQHHRSRYVWETGRGEPANLCARVEQQPTTSPTNGHWRDADWLFCRDGKWRPVEPSTFPLVAGNTKRMVRGSNSSLPFDANDTSEARVMRLKGYGNAINAEVATEFILAYMHREQP